MRENLSTVERETLGIEELARRLGINRSTAYQLARRNQLPVPVIRVGRRMVVSRHLLDQLLDGHHTPSQHRAEAAGREVVADEA